MRASDILAEVQLSIIDKRRQERGQLRAKHGGNVGETPIGSIPCGFPCIPLLS